MTHSNSCLVIQLPKFQALFSPVWGVGYFACLESLASPPGFNEWSPLLFLSGTRPFDLSCQSQAPPPRNGTVAQANPISSLLRMGILGEALRDTALTPV